MALIHWFSYQTRNCNCSLFSFIHQVLSFTFKRFLSWTHAYMSVSTAMPVSLCVCFVVPLNKVCKWTMEHSGVSAALLAGQPERNLTLTPESLNTPHMLRYTHTECASGWSLTSGPVTCNVNMWCHFLSQVIRMSLSSAAVSFLKVQCTVSFNKILQWV